MKKSSICGTYSGAAAHYRRGEKPCEDCRQAARKYQRERAAAKRKPNVGKCVICQGPLTGQQKVTCSPKCRRRRNNTSSAFKVAQARYRERVRSEAAPQPCAWCGEDFLPGQKRTRFCSQDCYALDRHGVSRPVYFPTCLNCAAVFTSRRAGKATCSQKCWAELESKTNPRPKKLRAEWRTERECPGCACRFSPLHTPNMVTCSKRCSRRVHRWRRKAAERNAPGAFTWSEFMRIARRFDYCCAYCGGKPDQLEPDHVVPLSRGGGNSTTNLLPSCHPCNADKNAWLLHEWAEARVRRGLPARHTNWSPEDKRYWHLTDATLRAA